MKKLIEAYNFFKGKKRRISMISLALASVLPGEWGQFFFYVGSAFGVTDIAEETTRRVKDKKAGK